MPLTDIPDSFGSGGANLAPGGSAGDPNLRDILREHKVAIEALQTTDASEPRVGKRSISVVFGDLAVAATSKVLNVGVVLPTGARVTGREIRTATPGSGGAVSALTVDIGGTDDDAIVAAASVFTGAPAAQGGTSGINPTGTYGGQQLTATFKSTGANLSALTAGAWAIDVWYLIDP